MTITLTSEEIFKFQGDLAEWYRLRFEFVLTRALDVGEFVHGATSHMGERIERLMGQFETAHPKPDWRTLL
jgi:hypothetical protein